jgi:hypothetical protein
MESGYGDGHGVLAVVRLSQLSTILPRHPDRMCTLLGKSGVINDPRQNRSSALHIRQDIIPNRPRHRVITLSCLGHTMMQGLVVGTHLARSKLCCHGFETFALNRQQHARAIRLKRFHPVCMTQRSEQMFRVRTKPGLDIEEGCIFHASSIRIVCWLLHTTYDIVVLGFHTSSYSIKRSAG